jgi:hypothetical protein
MLGEPLSDASPDTCCMPLYYVYVYCALSDVLQRLSDKIGRSLNKPWVSFPSGYCCGLAHRSVPVVAIGVVVSTFVIRTFLALRDSGHHAIALR